MRWLRDRNWLTVDVLQTMPLAYFERYSWSPYYKEPKNPFENTLFEPIYRQVLSAIQNEALIPAHTEGYIVGKSAKLAGSSELRNLLDKSHLQQLFGVQQAGWVTSDITERRTRDLWRYLHDMIEIEEIDLDKFIRKLSSDFLEEQADQWIEKFYEVANQFEHRSIQKLKTQPIIRLKDGTHLSPFDNKGNPKVFLPSEQISLFPTVKVEVCKSISAMKFLRDKLELHSPDSVDEVRRYVLPKYEDGSISISDPEHINDIAHILRAIQDDSVVDDRKQQRLIDDLKSIPFLLATNSDKETRFCHPKKIYFRSPELAIYFEDNPHAWFASPDYDGFRESLSDLGVESNVRIQRKGRLQYDNRVIIKQWHGWHVHGINGFDPDCTFDGLEFAIKCPSFRRSQNIWNRLLLRHKSLVMGVVETSTRKDFVNPTTETKLSKLGLLVAESEWLPNSSEHYVRPSDMSLDDLPEGFTKDDELAAMLGMRTSSHDQVRDILESHGIEDESAAQDMLQFIELLKSNPQAAKTLLSQPRSESTLIADDKVEQEEIDYRSSLYEAFNRPITSRRSSLKRIQTNSRDLADAKYDIDYAKSLEPEESERKNMVLTKKWEGKNKATRTFLHSQYDGRCQICDFTFAKRLDRSPYFEGVYLVSYKKARWLDRPGNVLCLCPNHVSEFLYGTVEAEDIFDQIRSYQHGELHDIEIELCENIVTIRFTRDHITELIALLESE